MYPFVRRMLDPEDLTPSNENYKHAALLKKKKEIMKNRVSGTQPVLPLRKKSGLRGGKKRENGWSYMTRAGPRVLDHCSTLHPEKNRQTRCDPI